MAYIDITEIEGKKLCLVYIQVIDEKTEKFRMKCHYGRAHVENKRLSLMGNGREIPIPPSAYNKLLPSDGTHYLKDSEYFIMVKMDKNIDMAFQDKFNIPKQD
ncbi:MAG: hypothetical protein U9O87_05635 [Verrucomicrobiota bacterium]|nr:hypothetical protein [Verrucomicrobiota bacterium]